MAFLPAASVIPPLSLSTWFVVVVVVVVPISFDARFVDDVLVFAAAFVVVVVVAEDLRMDGGEPRTTIG